MFDGDLGLVSLESVIYELRLLGYIISILGDE